MPKKIHKFHNCKTQGCMGRTVGQVICGVQKKEQVIEVPGQPNVSVIYGVLIQCIHCKTIAIQEVIAPQAAKEEAKIIGGV